MLCFFNWKRGKNHSDTSIIYITKSKYTDNLTDMFPLDCHVKQHLLTNLYTITFHMEIPHSLHEHRTQVGSANHISFPHECLVHLNVTLLPARHYR